MKNKALLLTSLIHAETAGDQKLQYILLRAMADAIAHGEELDGDAFSLLVEDSVPGRAVSVRRAAKLVQETGAFVWQGGVWIYASPEMDQGKPLDWNTFLALFEENTDASKTQDAAKQLSVDSSIGAALAWTVEMTNLALRSGQIDGQPAFYTCEADGDKIIGFKAAGTATADSLTALCQSVEDLPNCGKSADELHSAVSFLLEKTLATQCKASGWDRGGFYPLEDQPDADHPTVDATCLAVMALCEFLGKRSKLETVFEKEPYHEMREVMDAIVIGIEFLLRMQNEDGSFSIYRYENGTAGAPNENCTRAVQSTLGMGKGSGAFDHTEKEDLYPKCSRAIADTWRYLSGHTAEDEGRKLWAPYFGTVTNLYRAADVINSSAKVGRSFIPIWWQMEEARPQLFAYWRSLADFWSDYKKEAEQEIGFYRFSTPTTEAFSSGEYAWASHPDMLAAFTILQAHNLFDFRLSARNWELIEGAVQHALALQHPHGHWDNPLAKKTPFCAATFAAIELLQEYRRAKQPKPQG